MQISKVYQWIEKEPIRQKVLAAIAMPLTAKQLSERTGIPRDTCSYQLKKFVDKRLVICLNPEARNSRLFWLTQQGKQCQRKFFRNDNLQQKNFGEVSEMDWSLYGWVCYAYRAGIIRVLTYPMRPTQIKQKIRHQMPHIKISANNIRDVLKELVEKDIVRKVFIRKKTRPLYKLTRMGNVLKNLLLCAKA